MSLRIQIDCYHEYRCQCKPIPQTKVSKQQIVYNLIRCNSGLARYFGKTSVVAQTMLERNEIKRKQEISPYKSIVDQKNLNILMSQKYPIKKVQQPIRQRQKQQQSNFIPSVQLQINNFVSTQVQTSPLYQKPQQKKQVKSPRQKQIKQYFKQLKQTSRYLSDTGFRKYFNRQVFQNYGRENTHGTNDGIIYGNYMKTHNINPHTGSNQPHDEETFYHALATASPQKLLSPKNVNINTQQNRTRNMSQSRFKEDKQILQKPLKKHQNDSDQIIGDNLRIHQNLQKLSKSRSKSKGVKNLSPNPIKNTKNNYVNQKKIPSKSPINKKPNINSIQGQQTYTSPRIQSQYVNTKQIIQPIRPNIGPKNELSPRSNLYSQRQELNKLSEIKSIEKKCPVDVLKQNHKEHILSKQCKVKPSSLKKSIFY